MIESTTSVHGGRRLAAAGVDGRAHTQHSGDKALALHFAHPPRRRPPATPAQPHVDPQHSADGVKIITKEDTQQSTHQQGNGRDRLTQYPERG